MSIVVPRSWIACDAANAALLGNAPDPYDIRGAACHNADGPAAPLRALTLNGSSIQFLQVAWFSRNLDPDKFAASLSDDALAQERDHDCATISQAMSIPGLTVSGCATSSGTIAGRPSKIISFGAQFADPNTGTPFHDQVRAELIVVTGGVIEILLQGLSLSDPKIDAATDAIVASITVQ